MAYPVTCPSCGKAFQLATNVYERKVAGKIVSIKCKQCQTGIRVDATEVGTLKVVGMTPPGGGEMSVGPKPPEAPQPKAAPAAPAAAAQAGSPAAAAPAAGTPMRMRQPTLIGMVSPKSAAQTPAVTAPKPAPPPLLWAVNSGGIGDDRELSDEEIRLEIHAGTISPQTLVWRDGMDEWLEIEKVPDLQKFLAPAPAPAPARREQPAPAPAPAPREQPAPAPAPAPKVQSTGFEEEADAEPTMIYDRSAPNASFEPFPAALREKETTARVMLEETARLAESSPDQETTTRMMLSQAAKLVETPPAPPLPAAGRPAAFGKSPQVANAARPPITNAPPPPLAETPRPALADAPRPPLAERAAPAAGECAAATAGERAAPAAGECATPTTCECASTARGRTASAASGRCPTHRSRKDDAARRRSPAASASSVRCAARTPAASRAASAAGAARPSRARVFSGGYAGS